MARKKADEKSGKVKVHHAWAEVLGANEALAKAGKKPKTDEALYEEMAKRFPEKKKKTTLTRVNMIRSIYNKGTGMFISAGPAGKPGRPTSHRYDEKGQVVPGRKVRADKAPPKSDRAAKKSKAEIAKAAKPKLQVKEKEDKAAPPRRRRRPAVEA